MLFLLTLIDVGTFMVSFGNPSGDMTGLTLITDKGDWFPNGVPPALIVIEGVVFAFDDIELLGTTSGEAKKLS